MSPSLFLCDAFKPPDSLAFIAHVSAVFALTLSSVMFSEAFLRCYVFQSCHQKEFVTPQSTVPSPQSPIFCLKPHRWKVSREKRIIRSHARFSHCGLLHQMRGHTPSSDTDISHPPSSYIAASAFTPAACEAMLPSLAKAHLFKRVGYIAARSVWWLQSDPHRSSLNLAVRQDHPPSPHPLLQPPLRYTRYIGEKGGGGMTDKERE